MATKPFLALLLCLAAIDPVAADGLRLKKDVELRGSAAAGRDAPIFITADVVESNAPDVVEASGRVEARQAGRNFYADWLRYDLTLDELRARGNVRLEQPTLVVSGDTLRLRLDTHSGELTHPVYRLADAPGRGQADTIRFLDDDHYRLAEATYTTCPVGNDDWYLKVGDMEIDKARDVGTARDATLRFLGVPLLYTPWLDFSLNDERKSGLLAPTIGTTQRSGLDVLVPYYLNLAPNYDATLFPRYLSKRGVQFGGEFRYLTESFRGESRVEALPGDNVAGRTRWGAFLKHAYHASDGWNAGINFERVSDDDYFRDLSNQVKLTSISHLNQELWADYTRDWWRLRFQAQRFQTLQDPSAPIDIPYNRVPSVRLDAVRPLAAGPRIEVGSEFTRFDSPDPAKTTGNRFWVYPTMTLPITRSFGFLTPKIGVHSSVYALDHGQTLTRNVPIASVDAGVYFDREFSFLGEHYEQTLEPRAYYVYAPFREQSKFPVFDTALMDFSYAQMFTENQFIGQDRINDANQITLALTSRFVEPDSGAERLRVTLGQRFFFNSQKVTLPGVAPRDSFATDLLAALGGQITRDWKVDAAWQFDTDTGTTVRQNLGAVYRPAPGKLLNLSYRFTDQSAEQIDVSGQWPLAARWYGMYRYNYSLRDNKLAEGLVGLEYNGGCWLLRGVFQRLATKETQSTDALFFQLELKGMGRLGANPLDVLKQSIHGYRPSNEISDLP